MPEATLKFKIPEDRNEFNITCHAIDWALTVYDIDNWLRGRIKHAGKDYEEIRDELWRIIESRNLHIDMIE